MNRSPATRKIAAAFAATSLLVSSAASASVRPGDYVASSSGLSAASYQVAACAAGAASAAAAGSVSAAQAVQAQPGCVLPVVDAPARPVATAPPPVYAEPVAARGGIGTLPLVLGLAAIAGALALLLLDDDDDDGLEVPISPA